LIALALGGLLLSLLSALPAVGLLITAFITFIGLGAILLGLRRDSRAVPAAALEDEPIAAPPPPPPALLPRGPGTDNLPQGFSGDPQIIDNCNPHASAFPIISRTA
jgi:hypothetical protein